jgi:hypothetical protein
LIFFLRFTAKNRARERDRFITIFSHQSGPRSVPILYISRNQNRDRFYTFLGSEIGTDFIHFSGLKTGPILSKKNNYSLLYTSILMFLPKPFHTFYSVLEEDQERKGIFRNKGQLLRRKIKFFIKGKIRLLIIKFLEKFKSFFF